MKGRKIFLQKVFTPLGRAADFNRRPSPIEADGGIKPPPAQTVRERSSLTGFTLVELLIVAAIFSIITLCVYSVFSTGFSILRRSEESGRLYQEAKFSLDDMSRQLKMAVTYDFGTAYPDIKAFDGKHNEISFLVATDSGLRRIRYSLSSTQPAQAHTTKVNYQKKLPSSITARFERHETQTMFLEKSAVSFLESLAAPEDSEASTEALASLVTPGGLSFRYAYIRQLGDGHIEVVWDDTWQDNAVIPNGVQINLELVNPKKGGDVLAVTKTVFLPTGKIALAQENEI